MVYAIPLRYSSIWIQTDTASYIDPVVGEGYCSAFRCDVVNAPAAKELFGKSLDQEVEEASWFVLVAARGGRMTHVCSFLCDIDTDMCRRFEFISTAVLRKKQRLLFRVFQNCCGIQTKAFAGWELHPLREVAQML